MYLSSELYVEGSPRPAAVTALDELDLISCVIYARVGNRADAEDLTQQVALKALPRLRAEAAASEIRGYLFATARSVVAAFWALRYRVPESELGPEVADDGRGRAPEAAPETAEWLERTLAGLPAHYRLVLELRFLRGSSLREAAGEMGKSVGAIKLMQLRALRAAAAAGAQPVAADRAAPGEPPSLATGRSRRSHRRRAVVPGSPYAPELASRAF
ncbi:MAG: RNA polymerase sigma factor [Candidatus Dormibacteraceae bacterium]